MCNSSSENDVVACVDSATQTSSCIYCGSGSFTDAAASIQHASSGLVLL